VDRARIVVTIAFTLHWVFHNGKPVKNEAVRFALPSTDKRMAGGADGEQRHQQHGVIVGGVGASGLDGGDPIEAAKSRCIM
jgi:hypothetical protein